MSYPILYRPTDTDFDNNGLGILTACVSCEVTEEANGIFELEMKYPADGIHFEDIQSRSIIKAKADQFRNPQLFRVYKISKPSLNGIVNIYAEHISYDLSGIPVKPFSAENAVSALAGLKTNAIVECPFDFWTDKQTKAKFSMSAPASVRSCLGGMAGSILSVYRGEYEFDNYTVKLHNNRGLNRGVSIRYGKNLTDIKQNENCSNIVTGVYPYWQAFEGEGYVELPEKVINTPGTHDFVKVNVLDFSQVFQERPTEEQLREYTENYIKTHELGIPIVSLTVSFAQLAQSEEYKHLALLERVSLCDTVNVEFPALGVSSTAKAVKMVYDVLADRVKSVTLGSVRANIADTIVEQQKEIAQLPNKSFLEVAIDSLTKSILGANGGSVRFLDTNNDGEPDTLYIADNPDPLQAVKVWRFNYEGWAASENGYSGPFKMGATLKDGIIADFITAGTLYGLLFKAGAIESLDGNIRIDLTTSGQAAVFNSEISTNGIFVRGDALGTETLFKIGTQTYKSDNKYFETFDLKGFGSTGEKIFSIEEHPDYASTAIDITDPTGLNSVNISATEQGANITFAHDGGGGGLFATMLLDGRIWMLCSRGDIGNLYCSEGNITILNGKTVGWEWDENHGTHILVAKE